MPGTNNRKRDLSKKQQAVSGRLGKEVFDRLAKQNKLKFYVLYVYSLAKKTKSHKVRFVYLLKGRPGEKGLVEKYKGQFLAPGCFIIPSKYDKDIQDVFALWKIKAKRKLILTY